MHIGAMQRTARLLISLNTPSRAEVEFAEYKPSYIMEFRRFFSYSHSKYILYKVYFLSFSGSNKPVHANIVIEKDKGDA